MKVSGNHTFNVSIEQLWGYLMDPEVLAKITPGVSKLESLDADHYKTISDIKIGPVKGSFKGKLKVVDKNEPNSFAIELEQLSKIGNAHGRIEMHLAKAENDHSALSFNGDAKLSGVIARTGQRVLSGVANTISKEVFASLEKHIEENGTKAILAEEIDTETPSQKEVPAVESQALGSEHSKDSSLEAKKVDLKTTEVQKNPPKESLGFWSRLIQFFKNLFK